MCRYWKKGRKKKNLGTSGVEPTVVDLACMQRMVI